MILSNLCKLLILTLITLILILSCFLVIDTLRIKSIKKDNLNLKTKIEYQNKSIEELKEKSQQLQSRINAAEKTSNAIRIEYNTLLDQSQHPLTSTNCDDAAKWAALEAKKLTQLW
jgi:cell division protein FtsL